MIKVKDDRSDAPEGFDRETQLDLYRITGYLDVYVMTRVTNPASCFAQHTTTLNPLRDFANIKDEEYRDQTLLGFMFSAKCHLQDTVNLEFTVAGNDAPNKNQINVRKFSNFNKRYRAILGLPIKLHNVILRVSFTPSLYQTSTVTTTPYSQIITQCNIYK